MIRNIEVGVCIMRDAKRNFLPETAEPICKKVEVSKDGFTKRQCESFADFAERMGPELKEYLRIMKGGRHHG